MLINFTQEYGLSLNQIFRVADENGWNPEEIE